MRVAWLLLLALVLAIVVLLASARPAGQHGAPPKVTPLTVAPAVVWVP